VTIKLRYREDGKRQQGRTGGAKLKSDPRRDALAIRLLRSRKW
jgi:hypothetical protein